MFKRSVVAIALVLSLLVSLLPVGNAAPAQSYPVCDIDFDDGSTGGIYPTGNSSSKLDSAIYHSAGYSLQIYNRDQNWNAGEWDLSGKMTAGNTYRFSAWVYHESETAEKIQLSFKINEGENYTYCRNQEIRPNEWTYVMGKYTVGDDEVSVKPYIELTTSLESFWVDDISIVQTGGYRVDTAIEENIISLKDAFDGTGITVGTSIGTSVMAGDVSGEQKELIVKHFDEIAIENQLKAQYVLDYDTSVSDLAMYNEAPAVDFTAAKPFFEFAKENGLTIKAQALVWFSMTPEWFFHEDYDVNKAYASRETMLKRLESYIEDVLTWCESNYPGMITSWIVVNEAFDGDANPSVRKDNFQKTIGDDYIAKAFEYAYKYRPASNPIYLYNDYNMEYYWEKTQFALDYLADCGAIENGWVDGIGFQCHIKMDWPGVSTIKGNCARVRDAGLMAEVTEIDISLREEDVQSYGGQDAAFEAQRLRYEEVIKAFLDAKEAGLDLKNITWWGLTDGYTWLVSQYNQANYPMLFDVNNKAKPAFYGVLDALGEGSENLALGKDAYCDSVQGVLTPDRAVDGDTSGESRWASAATHDLAAPYVGEYWWYVDLGEVKEFNKIVINWEVCYGKNYVIQVANENPDDPDSWTDITEARDGVNGGQIINFETMQSARYVKMLARAKATSWGCSFYEFGVYKDNYEKTELPKVYIGEDTEDIPKNWTLADEEALPQNFDCGKYEAVNNEAYQRFIATNVYTDQIPAGKVIKADYTVTREGVATPVTGSVIITKAYSSVILGETEITISDLKPGETEGYVTGVLFTNVLAGDVIDVQFSLVDAE